MASRGSAAHRMRPGAVALCTVALLVTVPFARFQKPPTPAAAPAAEPATTIDRVRATGHIRVGYRTDARPFSFGDESGHPTGYSIELCRRIADEARRVTQAGEIKVDWVPLSAADRFQAIDEGRIDLLCGAETVTLARRAEVSFSIPIFPGGIGALVRADAPAALRDVLSGRGQPFRPTWRASATRALQSRFLAAVSGTTAERWLTERIDDLDLIASLSRVSSYESGVQTVLQRRSDVLFGERAILLDAAKRHPSPGELIVVDRLFTYEPLALAFGSGDDAFRLLVDRALSRFYSSGDLLSLYQTWFGEPDQSALTFFRWNTLTD